MWAQLECGLLLPEEFGRKFSEIVQTMTKQNVDMNSLLPSIHTAMAEPYPEVLTAIQCIRAEGLKTALVTNNWWLEEGKSLCPVDRKYFDVVSTSIITHAPSGMHQGNVRECYSGSGKIDIFKKSQGKLKL